MPKVKANAITMNYDQQGTGEPLILIPYLAADHACYAFQVAEYAKHFTCISIDLRGTGESDNPGRRLFDGVLADDVAAFMQAAGVPKAHISGLSLGANVGMWLAAKHPEKVQSLSLHGGCQKSDLFIKTVLEGWQVMATALGSVPEMVIRAHLPLVLHARALCGETRLYPRIVGLRSKPAGAAVPSFMRQSKAAIAHDASEQLGDHGADPDHGRQPRPGRPPHVSPCR